MFNSQKGFTMLELMIAMALGLLIIAAATGVFLAGQRSLATQSGVGDLQQNAIFGIAQLTHDLRHINLNTTATATMTRATKGAGVVFSDANFENITQENVTKSGDANTVFRLASGGSFNNDQLTIQFSPHLPNLLQSCTGRSLEAGEVNVQRYFVRAMPQGDNRFGLYCVAQNNEDKFTDAPRLIIPDVEAFKVRFATKKGMGNNTRFQYKNIDVVQNDDEIVSVEVGLVMRSTHNLGSSNSMINNEKTYRIAGQEVRLINDGESPTYIREAFSQVVAIRNSSGG